MDRAEAESALTSEAQHKRLAGARFFFRGAESTDLPLLRKFLALETVPWVQRALQRAIDRVSSAPALPKEETDNQAALMSPDATERIVRGLRAQAVEEVAGTILHEFTPIIGALRVKAREEISAFDHSQTKKLLDQINDLIEAVRNLKRVAATPNYTEFDLADLVASSISLPEFASANVNIRIAGPKPFLVHADRTAMQIALSNGVRNAIEAVLENQEQSRNITVNWGRGGVENWLVVLDSGAGFIGDPEAALKLGVTNKQDHIGYGLATAQYAMRSMEGDVLLSNNKDGGARFELRWDEDNARTFC